MQQRGVGESTAVGLHHRVVEVVDLPPPQRVTQPGLRDAPQRVPFLHHVARQLALRGRRTGDCRAGSRRVAGLMVDTDDGGDRLSRQGRPGAARAEHPGDQDGREQPARPQPGQFDPQPRAVAQRRHQFGHDRHTQLRPHQHADDQQRAHQQRAVVGPQEHRHRLVQRRHPRGQQRRAEPPQQHRDADQDRDDAHQAGRRPHHRSRRRPRRGRSGCGSHGAPTGTSWARATPWLVIVVRPTSPSSTVGRVRVTDTVIVRPSTTAVPSACAAAR